MNITKPISLVLFLLVIVMPTSALATSNYLPKTSSQIKDTILLAQVRKSFTITKIWNSSNIGIKGSATGKFYDVYLAQSIGAEVGDIVTVIFKDDTMSTVINERNGKSSSISKVR